MPSPVSFTKATLSYPPYSVDFDPYNRGYLVVGGGGGAGKHGVGNKLTLLDTSSRSNLEPCAEIELSRDEDSVTSLANLATRDGLIALAGVNSSEADQKAGKNEHLRAYEIRYPKKRRQNSTEQNGADAKAEESGQISQIGKTSLFKPARGPRPETYQRILRLSPVKKTAAESRRIGAIATGLAKESEIVIFDATKTPLTSKEVITHIDLNFEAADIDIAEIAPSEFSVSWCSDYDVYEQTIAYSLLDKRAEFTPKGPRRVHSMSNTASAGQVVTRSKYRSLRFLTDHHVLMLSNLPDKKGAELSILHLYPTGPAALVFHKILPAHIKQATALDVCRLDSDKDENRQFAIAVGGQDRSIEVYTMNYTRPTDTLSPFRSFTTLRNVHTLQLTALTFSPFHSPVRAADSEGKEASTTAEPPSHPPPQYIRLASVSVANTVVVDTFALSPLEPKNKNSRYVLSHPSDERLTRTMYLALISFMVLITAVMLQAYFAPQSTSSLRSLLPPGARQWADPPANAAQEIGKRVEDTVSSARDAIPSDIPVARRIRDILAAHETEREAGEAHSKAVMLREPMSGSTEVGIEVIPNREEHLKDDTQTRQWHELEEHEQQRWKENLIKAGHWAADEGETVLKGVLFSSYAGLVGQAAAGVV